MRAVLSSSFSLVSAKSLHTYFVKLPQLWIWFMPSEGGLGIVVLMFSLVITTNNIVIVIDEAPFSPGPLAYRFYDNMAATVRR